MTDRERSAPLISLALLTWLEQTFPDRVPDADVPEHEKCALAGEQRVIRKLRYEHNHQNAAGGDDNT